MACLTQMIFLGIIFQSSSVFSQDTLKTLFQCDFEKDICGLDRGIGCALNCPWTHNQEGTYVTGTGPSMAADGRFYIYYEKAFPGSNTLTYIQKTPTPSNHIVLTFYLHQYGANIISFNIVFKDANGSVIDDPYILNGQIQSASTDLFIPISITKDLSRAFHTLEFTVYSSNGLKSAVAMDNIVLSAVVLANSSWTTWTSYSACSASCGPGTSFRSRICYAPSSNLQTIGCIGNATEVQTCNIGICSKSCDVNTSVICSSVNPPFNLYNTSIIKQAIVSKMEYWAWAVTTNLFSSCNPSDYNYVLSALNYDTNYVTAAKNNISSNIGRSEYLISCNKNPTMQQTLLDYCGNAVLLNSFLDVSMFQLQSYSARISSTVQNCNASAFSWTSWETWTPCSASCNGGYSIRMRYCSHLNSTNQQLNCQGSCDSCIGEYMDFKVCNTERCSNVLCDTVKNVDCSRVSTSNLDLKKLLNISSVNDVISEISVWPFLITEELFKSCNIDILVDQLTQLNSQTAKAYSARNNTLAHLEYIRDLIVCTGNSFVQPNLYDACLNAANQDKVLNAIVQQLNDFVQKYQVAIDACKNCGFACSVLDSFIQVFFRTGM